MGSSTTAPSKKNDKKQTRLSSITEAESKITTALFDNKISFFVEQNQTGRHFVFPGEE